MIRTGAAPGADRGGVRAEAGSDHLDGGGECAALGDGLTDGDPISGAHNARGDDLGVGPGAGEPAQLADWRQQPRGRVVAI
ncbi:MAG: hypothetical protein M3Z25_00050 [Actinomycetota bacterium]|nr:hypothetical protein [Actinomycetota bacterium]